MDSGEIAGQARLAGSDSDARALQPALRGRSQSKTLGEIFASELDLGRNGLKFVERAAGSLLRSSVVVSWLKCAIRFAKPGAFGSFQ